MSIYVNVLVILLLTKYILNQWPNLDNAKIQKAFLVISSITLALFTGLRDNYTGSDTVNYGRNFLNMRRYSSFSYAVSENTGRFEFLYKCWTKLIGYITDNVNVFFTLTAVFFAVSLAICIYKNSKNSFFSMILYFTVGTFSFQITGLRQSMAMAVLLFSIEFLKEKKLLKFLIIVWIASLFHKSAWSFLLTYPISYMKINFKNFIFTVSAFIFSIVYNSWVSKIANQFLGYEYGLGRPKGGEAVIGMLLLAIMLCYIFSEYLVQQSKYNIVFFNITVCSVIIYILRYFVQAAERISFYYQFAFIILLPNIIEAIPDIKTKKTVYTCAIILACALFYYRYQIKPSYYGFLWK